MLLVACSATGGPQCYWWSTGSATGGPQQCSWWPAVLLVARSVTGGLQCSWWPTVLVVVRSATGGCSATGAGGQLMLSSLTTQQSQQCQLTLAHLQLSLTRLYM